jgi:phage baseplate assembly protein gpV
MKYLFLIAVIILFILGIIFLKHVPANPPAEPGTGVDADITMHENPIPDPPENLAIKAKLNDIMIEHMEFEDATIPAVIKALQYEARQADTEKKGVNIVYLQNPVRNRGIEVEVDIDEEDDQELMLDDLEELPDEEEIGEMTITIMFDDLSLGEAIRNICIAGEMRYRVEEYAVVIADRGVPLDILETKIYPVDSEVDFGVGGGEYLPSVEDYFERQGVEFPNGSRIVYDDAISRVIATNTPDQLRRIERIIDELNVVDPQVLVTTRFLKIPDREFRKLKGNKTISLWEQVIRSDKAEIIGSASMVTQNGEEGTARMIREVYFPDSWGECGFSSTSETQSNETESEDIEDEEHPDQEEDTDSISEPQKHPVLPNGQMISYSSMPEFGEPTELGIRLTVTPTVDVDKYTITLDMIPVIKYFSGWREYDNNVKMAIIKAWTVTTQVTLYDGETFPLGFALEDVGGNSKRERNRFMMLASATLINPDGTPLRDRTGSLNRIPKRRAREPVKITQPVSKKSKTLIDNIHFEDADIENVVDFLNMEIKKKENLHIVLELDDSELSNTPFIDLNLRDMPFDELIRYICKVTGLEYSWEGDSVTIKRHVGDMLTEAIKVRSSLFQGGPPEDVVYDESDEENVNIDKSGQVLKSFVTKQGVYLPKGSNVSYDPKTGRYTVDTRGTRFDDYKRPRSNSGTSDALMNYFSARGVPFPAGASIAYSRRSQTLFVHNTRDNLRRLESLLRALDIEQPQVFLETTILEISNKELIEVIGKKAAKSDNFSKSQISKIIDSGKGRILSGQSVVANNGEEANVRLVNEIYYPDTWSSPEIAPVEGFLEEVSPVPEFSESTDVGSYLTFTPNVSPDNYTIGLSLSPQFLDFQGWTEYPNSYKIEGSGKVRTGTTNVKMAERGRKDLNIYVKIFDGETIMVARTQQIDISEKNNRSFENPKSWTEMLGDAKRKGEEVKNVFFFIKANITNPNGEFVRK